MVALANSHPKITVEAVDKSDLLSERWQLLSEVGYQTHDELCQHIKIGEYTERERIVAARLGAITWLLGRDA